MNQRLFVFFVPKLFDVSPLQSLSTILPFSLASEVILIAEREVEWHRNFA